MFKGLNKVNLPDGEYEGNWSGYTVSIPVEDTITIVNTKDGIRTIRYPVKVIVKNGECTIYKKGEPIC